MQMMNVLKPIAFDVLECLSQLFDYYLVGVSYWDHGALPTYIAFMCGQSQVL